MIEQWRELEEFPQYSVSNYGDVMNTNTSRILKPGTKYDGYKYVILCGKNRLVHRLVAITFIPTTSRLLEVDHIDGIKANNRMDNLEWVTRSENQRRAFEKGLFDRRGGPIMIVETGEIFATTRECADAINGHQSAVSNVLLGRRKHHLGYTFVYV